MAVKMFYARIDNSAEFKKILEVVKDIVPNVNLQISDRGLSFDSNELLHVVQIKMRLPVSYFSEYKCSESLSLGICLIDLYTIIKLGSGEDSLVFQYLENGTVLKIFLEARNILKICEFSLNLINVENDDCLYVEVQNCGRFEMDSKELYQTCNDLSQISEFLAISVNKMRVKFTVRTEIGGGSINIKQLRGENGMHIQTPKTINTEINLIYAKRITKAHVLAKRVEVKVYSGEPVVFCYYFNGSELKFYLAPAITD